MSQVNVNHFPRARHQLFRIGERCLLGKCDSQFVVLSVNKKRSHIAAETVRATPSRPGYKLSSSSNPSPNRVHGSTRYGGEKEVGKRMRTVVRGCIRCVHTYYLTSFILKNLQSSSSYVLRLGSTRVGDIDSQRRVPKCSLYSAIIDRIIKGSRKDFELEAKQKVGASRSPLPPSTRPRIITPPSRPTSCAMSH